MENVERLRVALLRQLKGLGYEVVPKRTSPLMWAAHVLMWVFMKPSGKSFIDDYITTGLGKIYVPIKKDRPQTNEEAERSVDVGTLAHEMTHVYQAKRDPIMHTIRYCCPQLPIMGAALLMIPVHVWLATLSPFGHLMILVYLVAIAFSFTPLVKLIAWYPRYEIERDAYITSAFVLHALFGYVERQHVLDKFTSQLSTPYYLWTTTEAIALKDAGIAHDAISRNDPTLLLEPSRRFVRETLQVR